MIFKEQVILKQTIKKIISDFCSTNNVDFTRNVNLTPTVLSDHKVVEQCMVLSELLVFTPT